MISKTCFFCGNNYTPLQLKEKTPSQIIKHSVNNVLIESEVIPYDDAFFEIIKGKNKGNLVHRWDIIK